MSRPSRQRPSHVAQMPPQIREAIQTSWAQFDLQDRALDATMALVHDPDAVQQVGIFSRSVANRARCPKLCALLLAQFPGTSKVSIFEYVALFLGLSVEHVRDLYYSGRQAC